VSGAVLPSFQANANEGPDAVTAAHQSEADVIEGEFRVVASRPIPARRKSPNRRRLIARIALWNAAAVLAILVIPRLFA
jgi:hypothetical protein